MMPESPLLGVELPAFLEGARAAHPDVDIPDEAFAHYLAERLTSSSTTRDAHDRLNIPDLYIACAVMRGNQAAFTKIERQHFASARSAVLRIAGPALADEILQIVRHKLFTADPGEQPKIAEYSGLGSLSGWLRVVAVRTALSLLRERQREPQKVSIEDHFDAKGLAHSPEIEYLKARYKNEFQTALRDALATLSARQRNLFRFHFLDGLNIDEIGSLCGVHRSTAARWLAEAREQVHDTTQRLLRERLGISDSEFESLVVLIKSGLDVSIHECLTK